MRSTTYELRIEHNKQHPLKFGILMKQCKASTKKRQSDYLPTVVPFTFRLFMKGLVIAWRFRRFQI